MNIVKSLVVLLLLIGLISVTVNSFFSLKKWSMLSKNKRIAGLLKINAFCTATIIAFVLLCNYTYPFDRTVELTLVEVVEVSKEEGFVNPGVWYGVYEGGLLCPGSESFHPNFIDEWLEPDLQRNSYIVCFGQKVKSLQYNVWDNTYSLGIKAGQIELYETFEPTKIYIYKIDKIRIDS